MKIKRWLNLVSFIGVLVVNALANILPINGQTTGEVSDSFPTLFTPAGYVFSIWGVIYIALGVFVIYQILPFKNKTDFVDRIDWWFILSCLFNMGWIVAWHYEVFLLSEVLMVGILIALIIIYVRLGVGRQEVPAVEKWAVHVPFSTYLAWISIAIIANTSVILYLQNWDGFGVTPELWTAIMVVIGGILGVIMTITRREVAFPLVVIWSFIGIVARRMSIPIIAGTAGVMALIELAVLVWVQIRQLSGKKMEVETTA